jgi:hypothetical protein
VDGFFIDSTTATHFHRCYNLAHHHPHPDVWNWGIRQMLRIVREEVDRVNPQTILFVEGAADMAREFADGFITHSHMWTGKMFTEPFVRYVYPQMRAFESRGSIQEMANYHPIQYLQNWNAVTGHRIYTHAQDENETASAGRRIRQYYDLYPEVCDNQMSALDVLVSGCAAYLFEAMPMVMTVANLTDQPARASLTLPTPCGLLFDRVTGQRVPVLDKQAILMLGPWEFVVFELRA